MSENSPDLHRPITGIYPLLRFARERHIPLDNLLLNTGLDELSLLDSQAEVSVNCEITLTKNLIKLTDIEDLSLQLGRYYSTRTHGVIGRLLQNSQTMNDALSLIIKYSTISNVFFRVHRESFPDHCRVYMQPQVELGDMLPFMAERDMSAGAAILEELLPDYGRKMVKGLGFAHAPLFSKSCYQKQLVKKTEFNTSQYYFDLDPTYFDYHISTKSTGKKPAGLLQQVCQAELMLRGDNTENISDKVATLIQATNAQDMPSIAARLNVTERTLRRQLKTENTGFRLLVSQARQQQAISLLSDPQWKIEMIAEQLGYSESSAFINAFKRWTGVSPNQYRQQHRVNI